MQANETDFQAAVIDRSHQQPVVVDFWAAWCAPCRTLGPVLEREVEKRAGQVELVKVDVDANPGLAQTYGVQSIPAVKAFDKGRVVSEFVGALPAASVARFLDSLLPSEADLLAAKGDEASLRAALEREPGHAGAALQLARILRARGEIDGALAVISDVRGSLPAEGMAARLRLERLALPQLAEAFDSIDRGEKDRALEVLIAAIPQSRNNRDEIRRVVVGILDELGVDHPLAVSSRSMLAAALY